MSWKDLFLDIIKLTDSVERLDIKTEKLSDKTIEIDKRVVRLETMVEIGQRQIPDKKG